MSVELSLELADLFFVVGLEFVNLVIVVFCFSLFASLPHLEDEHLIPQGFVLSLQPDHLVLEILSLLKQSFLLFSDSFAVLFFHFVVFVVELSFKFIFIVFGESFDSRLEFHKNIVVVLFCSLDFGLQVCYF